MKKRYSFAAGLLAAVLLLCMTASAAVIPAPDSELLYVTDTAQILSADTERYIAEQNDILFAATGAQFAVLTVETLPAGYDSESYCYEVFDAWGIGSAEKNNGLLLLLVPNEGKFWMVTGYGLQNHLTGGVLGELLDRYLAEDFDAGRYDDGVRALFDAVWEELELIYGPITESDGWDSDYEFDYEPPLDRPFHNGARTFAMLVILIMAILLVILIVKWSQPGRSYRTGTKPPPVPPGNPPYYRTYTPPRPTVRPPQPMQPPRPYHRPYHLPPRPPQGGSSVGTPPPFPGRPTVNRPSSSHPAGSFGSSRPASSRPAVSRPSGSFGSSRPSVSRPSPSRSRSSSFGGGRSHGGGAGRR